MNFKLRGTNVIGIEILVNKENFSIEGIKSFILGKNSLLKGSRIVVSVEDYFLTRKEILDLKDFIESIEGLTFCGFKTNIKENRDICLSVGIPCDLFNMQTAKEKERSEVEEVKFLRKTVRSGEKITSTGDLVILGDVNPGAEIEAGGNVYVMGSLRGIVKAGIGKSEGEVRSLYFEAPRIEIANVEKVFDRKEAYLNFRAKVKAGNLKIEFLEKGR
ncbi:MAG: septum site-determining protein MinC [Desulfurobacteriaceae bacterium]